MGTRVFVEGSTAVFLMLVVDKAESDKQAFKLYCCWREGFVTTWMCSAGDVLENVGNV